MKIDLNSDLGEGFGPWRMGDDEGLMKVISSANIACGFHAGDAVIMTKMVELAQENGVAIGAHCGLPDLMGFGRVRMNIPPRDLAKHIVYQLGALAAIATVAGSKVLHAGTHGVIPTMSAENPEYIEMILDAFKAFDKDLIYAGQPNGHGLAYAKKIGLRTAAKVFADRAYDDDGRLVNRNQPGAVITDHDEVVARIDRFLNDGTFATQSGKGIKFKAQSILVHSDTPDALGIAKAVRHTVERGGGRIVPFTELAT